MKRSIVITFIVTMISVPSFAQETKQEVKQGIKEGAREVKQAGQKLGTKSVELSSKGYHSVKDEKLNNKVGPDGQTVYMSGIEQYYYIDKKGRKIYISKYELKDK